MKTDCLQIFAKVSTLRLISPVLGNAFEYEETLDRMEDELADEERRGRKRFVMLNSNGVRLNPTPPWPLGGRRGL